MPSKPKIISSKRIAETRLFVIEDVHLEFSNGLQTHFERLRGRSQGSVMIIPMLDEKTFLLVREFGAGIESYTLGFPKGAIHSEEDILDTANRELMEEVGYGANQFEVMRSLSSSPAYSAGWMSLVLATDLYPKKLEGDEPEPIEVVPWSLDNVDELLNHPEFHEARSVVALLMLERRYRG